jgi:predicted site-specific integrase-resolvase
MINNPYDSMFTISQAANIIGVCEKSLRRWENQGIITPNRTPGNHRRYTMDMIHKIIQPIKNNKEINNKEQKVTVVYSRVSSHDQKNNGDLERQEQDNIKFCKENNYKNIIAIKDTASGLNTKRTGLKKLIQLIKKNKCAHVIITYRDRLTRFGYEYLQELFNVFGVSIIETKNTKNKTVQEELVNDMMSLIACFSGRLYGMRSKKKEHNMNGS